MFTKTKPRGALAAAVCGQGVAASAPAASRVNLLAEADGVVQVDAARLLQINQIEGLTIATMPTHALVRAQAPGHHQDHPFAVEEAALRQAEAISQSNGPIVSVAALRQLVGIVLVGSATARTRIERGVLPALAERIAALGSSVANCRARRDLDRRCARPASAARRPAADRRGRNVDHGSRRRDAAGHPPGRRLGRALRRTGRARQLAAAGLPAGQHARAGAGRARLRALARHKYRRFLLLPLLAGEQIRSQAIVALGHGGPLS